MSQNYNSTIEDLKAQLNIVDVVSRAVPLKRAGANFKGVCPFHNEKTPSFVVSEQKQIFTCFGCGASGDAIEFTKRFYNLEFQEACEKLAKENGITIDLNFGAGNKQEKDRVYEMNRTAARFFLDNMTKSANPGYKYIRSRGIEDSTIVKFGIGYAPAGWDNLLNYMKSKGYTEEELAEFSLLRKKDGGKYYDYFRNRIIFPIINTTGKVVGFQSRKIDPEDPSAKYINTLDNLVFHKKDTIFGINLTKQDIAKEGMAILVEGNMDVVSLYQAGVHNVGASCGTALNENQAKLLKRYANTVCLCYDSDSAGQEADLRGIEVLTKAGLKVKVMSVTSGKDPDEFVKEFGREAFMKLAEEAMTSTEFKLKAAKKGLNLNRDDDKIDYVKRATAILKQESPATADIYIKKLASELKISEGAIRMEVSGKSSAGQDSSVITRQSNVDSENLPNLSTLEATIIKVLLINPNFTEKLLSNENIFESELGMKVKNIMFELYGMNGQFEESDVFDRLETDESQKLAENLASIVIAGNEENVFEDCIRDWRLKRAKLKEKLLIDRLSLADEQESSSAIEELTKELMDVQKEIKSLGGKI